MIFEKGPKYYSKVLLFGEYALMSGSKALSIPYNKFYGQLLFDTNFKKSRSNHYSVAYLVDYYHFLQKNNFDYIINLEAFYSDINDGLFLECNIPISYGLGSSGAIVASVYNAYSVEKDDKDLVSLKAIFAKMESYYHGKSSGLDPLVSYLGRPIIASSTGEVKSTEVSLTDENKKGGIFLIDTEVSGETQPLVNWYLEEILKQDFKSKIENQLIPLNEKCIVHMLGGNIYNELGIIETLSQFTYDNFQRMIPESISNVWKKGIESGNYYLKLCGSGGGGMMLGFTNNLETSMEELIEFKLHIIN